MKEKESAKGCGKRVPTSRAKKHEIAAVISCWGIILVGAFFIVEIIETGSFTSFLQRFTQPSLILFHIMLLLSIPVFMIIGYFYQKLATAHEKLEQYAHIEISKSKEEFRNLFNLMPDPAVIVDKNGNFLAVNDRVKEKTGFKKEELVGKNFLRTKIVTAKSKAVLMRNLAKRMMGTHVAPYEVEVLTKDGEKLPYEVNATRIEYNGKPADMVAFRDLVERRELQKALAESEEKYRRQFEEALDAIFVAEAETGILIDCNWAASELVGRQKSELIGKHQRFLHPSQENEGEVSRTFKQHLKEKEGQVLETQVVTKKGEIKDVAIKANIFELEGKKLIQGIFRDITERKRAEERVRESEEKYRGIVELAPDGIATMDFRGVIISINPAVTRLLGYSEEEIVGKDFSKTANVQAGDMLKFMETFNSVSRGKVAKPFEVTLYRKDGTPRLIEVRVGFLKKKDKIIGIQAVMTDITERKEKEKAVRESQQKFQRLFMSNPEAAVYLNQYLHVIEVNPHFTKLFGYSQDKVKGKRINDLVVPKNKREEAEYLDKRALEGYVSYDTIRKRKDGSLVPVSISTAPMAVDGKPVGSVTLYKDITERSQMQKKLQEYSEQLEELVKKRTIQLEKTQEQLLKSERLAAIGELAAMVGHDLCNPLAGISNASYYLKKKLASKMDERSKEMLELIDKDVEYSNAIIKDLLDYAKEIKLELTGTTPKSIVNEALSMLEVPKNIQVSDATQNEPRIKVDVEKMKRILVNIIKNAVDAMPKGGKLTIDSKKTNGNAEITVTDTGTGIPNDILEKIWTPLFTTKTKGVGLGLSICKRIIETHKGNISVKSTVGKGTTFTITIPIEPKLEGGEKVWVKVPESLLSTTTKA